MDYIDNSKAALRKQALAKRNALDKTTRQKIANQFTDFIEHSSLFHIEKTIAAYWPIHSELDTRKAIRLMLQRQQNVALPAIIADGIMEFRAFHDEKDLEIMAFNTKGPAKHCPIIFPAMILLPLSAFDKNGNRIGYGGGYYDRVIASLQKQTDTQKSDRDKKPLLMGVAYDCQQVLEIIPEPHDIKLDMVWTESGLLIC